MQILKLPTSKTRDIIILFFLVLAVLLFRRYDAFIHPQLWAEDCTINFDEAEKFGIKSLFIPYSGYLMLLQKLIALFFSALSINYLYIPACYNYTAFFGTFLVAFGMYESACYLNLKHKLIYATWFLFMPICTDQFMLMGSLGWLTGIYLINYIFVQNEIKSNLWFYMHLFLLLIISMTQPFAFLYSPLIILIIISERKEMTLRELMPLCVILLGPVIQLCFVHSGYDRPIPQMAEPDHLLRLITNNIGQLFFFKSNVLPDMSDKLQIVLCLLIFVVLVATFIILYRKITAKRKYVLLGAAIITYAAFIKVYWPKESVFLVLTNARYYFVPLSCVGWICIIALDKKITTFHIGTYLAFFLLHSHFVKSELPDKQWKKQIREFYENKRDTIDINPDGWKYVPDRSKLRK
jgi:hypothetical protein